jgi:hypothetical protein
MECNGIREAYAIVDCFPRISLRFMRATGCVSLRLIDEAARRSGESRSAYLARVGIESARRTG